MFIAKNNFLQVFVNFADLYKPGIDSNFCLKINTDKKKYESWIEGYFCLAKKHSKTGDTNALYDFMIGFQLSLPVCWSNGIESSIWASLYFMIWHLRMNTYFSHSCKLLMIYIIYGIS